MKIKDRIKKLRISAEMTQEELAKHLGVSKQAVYKYETGLVTNIPMDKIAIMSELFGVSPSQIMGWEEKIITREEVSNRISIVQQYKRYSIQQICDLIGISENKYKNLLSQNFDTNDTTLANLSERSGFPIEFLNGLGYTTQNPIDQWSDDYQQDYFLASDYIKMIIESKIGAPAYKPKSGSAASLSPNRQKLIEWAQTVPEDKVEPILQALQSILAALQ